MSLTRAERLRIAYALQHLDAMLDGRPPGGRGRVPDGPSASEAVVAAASDKAIQVYIRTWVIPPLREIMRHDTERRERLRANKAREP